MGRTFEYYLSKIEAGMYTSHSPHTRTDIHTTQSRRYSHRIVIIKKKSLK